MADNQRKAPKDPDLFNDRKLWLFANAPLQDGARTPYGRFKKIENNPCFEVDTGLKTEGKNGREGYPIKIETPMDPIAAATMLRIIERLAAFKGEMALELENWGHPFIWDRDAGKNVRSKERMVISRFQIAKRADGMMTLSIAAPKKPDVVLEFKPGEFHPIMQNGQPAPISLTSELTAQSWATYWLEVLPNEFRSSWKEPEFQRQRRIENMQRANGGGGYQGGNRNNGGGGGYNGGNQGGGNGGGNYQNNQGNQNSNAGTTMASVDAGFDDDLPF